MHHRPLPALRLDLTASRYPGRLACLLHGVALPMIMLSGLPRGWQAAALALVLASAVWHAWFRQLPAMPAGLRLLPDGRWGLHWGGVAEAEASLLDGVYRSSWLIRLPLRLDDGRRLNLMLWPDSAPTEQLRGLRVWLRWGARPVADAGAALHDA